MKKRIFCVAFCVLISGLTFAQATDYLTGKLVLSTGRHVYDWDGHYTSANSSVDVYCDASSHEARCTDSTGPNSSLFIELEGESDAREHYKHTISPVAVFVEGKRTKLLTTGVFALVDDLDAGYDPLGRLKDDLYARSMPETTVMFKYRLSTVKLPRDKNIAVYCVPFTIEQTRKKKEIGKAAETCYDLYFFDLGGRPLHTPGYNYLKETTK
jgi:hypothetical protein